MKQSRYVILVEDDPTVLHSLRLQMRQVLPKHYLLETANDGQEALEVLQEITDNDGLVPLIVTDHQMPNMTGSEFLIAVKHMIPRCRNIMLTGEAGLSDITTLVNEQALFRYLTKPWNQSDLEMTVLSALESFNQEFKLEKLNWELAQTNANLEKLVLERTRELSNKTKQLKSGLDFASLMQLNLLPKISTLNSFFRNIDYLFQPQESVSGDFYYTHIADKSTAYFIIGDCTGHGVAGAFLSNYCMSILNSYFDESLHLTPKQIITHVINKVRVLAERASVSMSGLISVELTIAKFDKVKGAVSVATNSKQLFCFKDYISIEPDTERFQCYTGKEPKYNSIQNRGSSFELLLSEVDQMLFFTDGICDQFIPKTGKKMYRKGLKSSILEIEQKGCVNWFNEIKGNLQQIDDATMINILI